MISYFLPKYFAEDCLLHFICSHEVCHPLQASLFLVLPTSIIGPLRILLHDRVFGHHFLVCQYSTKGVRKGKYVLLIKTLDMAYVARKANNADLKWEQNEGILYLVYRWKIRTFVLENQAFKCSLVFPIDICYKVCKRFFMISK